MKGSYAIVMRLDREQNIEVGSLGEIRFRRGYYLYVGSALNGLENRIKRHLSNKKSMHWHIDYLTKVAKITDVMIKESDTKEECSIAKEFDRKFRCIHGFGSSDCKCKSHLFFSGRKEELIKTTRELGMISFKTFQERKGEEV